MKLIVAVLLALGLFWYCCNHGPVSTVSADGRGRVFVPADFAEATVTANAAGPTATAVNDVLATRATSVVAFLKANGQARDLTTEAIEIQPNYDTVKGVRVQNGYTGHVDIRFVSATTEIGNLIDGSLSHGADASGGFTRRSSDEAISAARQKAIDAAVADALAKARDGLRAAGLTEVRIRNLNISTGTTEPSFRAFAVAGGSAIPVEGGHHEVTATASVVLEFRKGAKK